jgi:hypothetical protein
LGEREYTWTEAEQIIVEMHKRGMRDDIIEKYFSAWAEHEEYAPDYFNLLRMIVPIDKEDGNPDLAVLAKLDHEAKKRGQRILFTVEDAAKDFYEFYDKLLTQPLTRELEKGADGNELVRYFEYEEFHKVPDHRAQSPDKVEKAAQEIAQELLEWLRGITPEKILEDIKRTLDDHYDKGLASASPEDSYYHKSDYVAISAHKSESIDKSVDVFLTPARLHGVIRDGYEGVYYPRYHVLVNS